MAKQHESLRAPQHGSEDQRSTRALWRLTGIALIAACTVVVYLPSLRGGFLLDDNVLLTDSALIRASDGLYRFWFTTEAPDYWPVSNSTLWIEWRLWGARAAGYRVTNLVLHVATVALLWVVLERLSIPGAFFGALLFALHPVNVETVAWIAQRKGLLALLFLLLAVLCYLNAEPHPSPERDRPRTGSWYGLSLAMFALALLSKASVMVLPLLLVLTIAWIRPLTPRDVVRVAPFFLLAVVSVGVNLWFRAVTHGVGIPGRTASALQRLLGAGAVVWFYLSEALLPVHLLFLYPEWHIRADEWQWWLPVLAALITTWLLWRYRASWSRPFWYGWLYFCVALAPVMGFTDVGFMQPLVVADHYQHLALIGVIALVAADWGAWAQRAGRGAALVAVGVIGVLGFLTWQQSHLYADAMFLYQTTLERNPDSWLAHTNVGSRLLAQPGRQNDAIAHYEAALRLRPDFTGSHYNLAVVLARVGRSQEAIDQFQEALRLNPDYPEAEYDFALELVQVDRLPEAIEHFRLALHLRPEFPRAHYDLGKALARTGALAEAIGHLEEAAQQQPEYAEGFYTLGVALTQAGRFSEAIEQFERALRLNPDYAEAHNDLGVALDGSGRHQQAIPHFREALRLKPDYADAQYNLSATQPPAGARGPE